MDPPASIPETIAGGSALAGAGDPQPSGRDPICLAFALCLTAAMPRLSPLLATTVLLLSGCGAPDTRALQKLACEQAAASLDMQSVTQLDALRKALGVAPGVDPIEQCRSLGAAMDPASGRTTPSPSSAGSSAPSEQPPSNEERGER